MIKYGINFGEGVIDLQAEMHMIQNEGYVTVNGKKLGKGLVYHYEQMRRIIWPELDDHRWHRVCRDEIVKNKITVIIGPGSSGKTHSAAWLYLCEYWCFPQETCVLVSSTTIQKLRMVIWGEMTMLWQKGIDRFPELLTGHLLDSKIAITTDDIDDGDFEERRVRDMRKGIVGIPCIQGGKFVGLAKFLGIKQKRVRLIADEASAMGESFLSAFSNLNNNEDFRAIVIGNPNDPLDPLGKAAEPIDGWGSHMEPTKTDIWKTRFMNGTCINLIGTDSPNFDFPADQPTRYKYLISKEKIAQTLSFFSRDSVEYYSQCVGVMKISLLSHRVLTRDLCRQFRANEPAVWQGSDRTKIAGLDSSYGGDRCALTHCEFGKEAVSGNVVAMLYPIVIVPIRANPDRTPEDQIADFCKNYCNQHGIPPENFFHDSTGRGTLGTSLARVWSSACNPVEFGGSPTERPVSLSLYIYDEKEGRKRLKTCKEHYSKLVTEFWYSVRYCVEGSQLRGLPEDAMDEFCMRDWRYVGANKIEIETKSEMKERVGRSPDLADCISIVIEGCRRRGFQMVKALNEEEKDEDKEWMRNLFQKQKQLAANYTLTYD